MKLGDNMERFLEETETKRRQLWFDLVDIYEKLVPACEDDNGVTVEELEEAASRLGSNHLAHTLLEERESIGAQNTQGTGSNIEEHKKCRSTRQSSNGNKTSPNKLTNTTALKDSRLSDKSDLLMTKTFMFGCADKPIKICNCKVFNVAF